MIGVCVAGYNRDVVSDGTADRLSTRKRALERAARRMVLEARAVGIDPRALLQEVVGKARADAPEITAEQVEALVELQRLRAFVLGDPTTDADAVRAIEATRLAADHFHNRDRKRHGDGVPVERTKYLVEWLDQISKRRDEPPTPARIKKLASESVAHHEGLLAHGRWIGTRARLDAWRTAIAEWQVGAWALRGRSKPKRDAAWELLSLLLKGSRTHAGMLRKPFEKNQY